MVLEIGAFVLLAIAMFFLFAIFLAKYFIYRYIKQNYDNKILNWSQTNDAKKQGAIVFLGDSITDAFMVNEYFNSVEIYNRGIFGDTTIGVLNRLKSSVYDLSPSKIFILIGVNDLDNTNDDVTEISKRIGKIISNSLKNNENIKIFIQSVYPVNKKISGHLNKLIVGKRNNEKIIQLNALLKLVAIEQNAEYINVYDYLIDDSGNLKKEYTTEGLHLSALGYKKVAEILTPFVVGAKNNE